MAFQKGHKLSPGRKLGSQNKEKALVREIIEGALGKSLPVALLEKIAKCSNDVQIRTMLDLMEYCYPKLRAMEVQADVTADVTDTKSNELIEELADHYREGVISPAVGTDTPLY